MSRIKYLFISLILIFSLLIGSGCTLIPEVQPEPPTPGVENSTPSTSNSTTTTSPTSPDIGIDPSWTIPPCRDNKQLPDFVAVVTKVKPSVVTIETEIGGGTGWIIDEDGILVTNNHVVFGAQNIVITMDDGSTFNAEEIRTDPLTDLAVVTVDAQNLPAADVGDCSVLQVGEQVAAIGNALGQGIRMTGGWISRLDVSIQINGQTVDDLIETDAAINPGNSGGPLVNMAGEVIGINSIKIADIGIEGLGYAISMKSAQDILEQLIMRGYVIRPYLGVGLDEVTPLRAFLSDLDTDSGALIINVERDSPADTAGLEEGDVIVKLDNSDILTVQDLLEALHSKDTGQEVIIIYWRDGDRLTTTATLTESPPPPWL